MILQFATREPLLYLPKAIGAFNTKEILVTLFAVRRSIFAHVFTMEKFSTGFTFETPHMKMFLQGHQGLAILQFFTTGCARAFLKRFVIGPFSTWSRTCHCRCGLCSASIQTFGTLQIGAHLTKAVFSGEGHSFSGRKRLLASGTFEATLMIRFAQCRDHFTFYESVTFGTLGAKIRLITNGAIIFLVFAKIST